MNKIFKSLFLPLCLLCCLSCGRKTFTADYRTVPLPQMIEEKDGVAMVLQQGTPVLYPADNRPLEKTAVYLKEEVRKLTGLSLELYPSGKANEAYTGKLSPIRLGLGAKHESPEAYSIVVSSDEAMLTGAGDAGLFHAVQTFCKALQANGTGSCTKFILPAVEITDWPRFGYRGMMLDVSRHFFSVNEVKEFIDLLALHQMNVLHLHLTDDQGWRVEIKKYPQLTAIGSHRAQTVIGQNTGKYDGIPYGGYYTQDEIRDLVAYAAERYITIIPEIDMPGHMQGALAALPHLGCTGGPYTVWEQWGVSEDVLCAGNPQSLQFVKDVLDEIIGLFPSAYIHVGGDECLKNRWKECPVCQKAIAGMGLKDTAEHSKEEYLQSRFMTEVEKHIESYGRHLIGWDEILDGGLPPRATVMAWRGVGRGKEAAAQGHDVIMTPNSHLYFDFYQSKNIKEEPLAIGGYIPVGRVYEFEPFETDMSSAEKAHILGVQANMWTEYVPDFKHLQYMVLPRMDALSEVQWCLPENKDYKDFLKRVSRMMELYDKCGFNYARHLSEVTLQLTPDREKQVVNVAMEAMEGDQILYTLDGSDPVRNGTTYTSPLPLSETTGIRAVALHNGKASRETQEKIRFSKSSFRPINLTYAPNPRFTYQGASQLNDCLPGDQSITSERWLGFVKDNLVATVDMGNESYSKVSLSTCLSRIDWVFDARSISVEVSDDGITYRKVAGMELPPFTLEDTDGIKTHELTFAEETARYVRINVCPETCIPECHAGRGTRGFVFVDEIEIN